MGTMNNILSMYCLFKKSDVSLHLLKGKVKNLKFDALRAACRQPPGSLRGAAYKAASRLQSGLLESQLVFSNPEVICNKLSLSLSVPLSDQKKVQVVTPTLDLP